MILKIIELEKVSFGDMKKPYNFVLNTLSADDKYSLLNRDNLTQPMQIQLSQTQKAFCECFLVFSKCTLTFKHFQKKDDRHS